jgi:hypothetical protein
MCPLDRLPLVPFFKHHTCRLVCTGTTSLHTLSFARRQFAQLRSRSGEGVLCIERPSLEFDIVQCSTVGKGATETDKQADRTGEHMS